jgi:hypothetical protein
VPVRLHDWGRELTDVLRQWRRSLTEIEPGHLVAQPE